MSRVTAADRVRRVLAVVPWIVANPGERVADVAQRFGMTEETLLADLGVIYMVGLPPYSPDALVDVQIDDEGRVTIRLADFFARPLRLTPSQGLALLASSDGLLSVPGTDQSGALARALNKLEATLGLVRDETVDVHLGTAEESLLERLRTAAASAVEVEMRYYSYGRDEYTTRVVAPWRIFADSGNWYLHGWCRQADGERIFRVDRIENLNELSAQKSQDSPSGVQDSVQWPTDRLSIFHPQAGAPRIALLLAPEAQWVTEAYPCENVVKRSDGQLEATLVISALPWLERLLVRLGPAATVLSNEELPNAETLASDSAKRILQRYR